MRKQDSSSDVAVIIPCYNYARFLGDAIESCLRQTARPAELVVVDDGSTDDTPQVAQRLGVTCLRKPNGGLSSARNWGLRHTRQPLVLFLDADDMLKPDALASLRAAAGALGPEVGAVFGLCELRSEGSPGDPAQDTLPARQAVEPYLEKQAGAGVYSLWPRVLERLVRGNIVPSCSALIRRDVFDAVGPWNEARAVLEDREMWLRIASRFRLGFLDRTVAVVRKHGGNITAPAHWQRNHAAALAVLAEAARASWASKGLRRLCRRQCAREAYNIAQHLADEGRWREASAMMARSIRRRPIGPKAWAHWAHYGLRCLVGRGR